MTDQPVPNSLSKSWSCAVDSNNISNKNNFHHRPSALSAVSSRLPSFDGFQLSPIEDFNLDPNDRQYLFCCGKGHSTVGVKVIAGYVFSWELFQIPFWILKIYFKTGGMCQILVKVRKPQDRGANLTLAQWSRFLESLDLLLGSGFGLLTWACSPGRSKNAWAWTLGTGKPQALIQTQLDHYSSMIPPLANTGSYILLKRGCP